MPADVLVVLRYYPTLSETFVYREIAELQRRGLQVAIAALGKRSDGALQDELPKVDVWRRAHGLELAVAMGAGMTWHKSEARIAAWVRRARGVKRVHVHFAGEAAEWGVVVAKRLGVPCSVTVHAADLFKPRPGLGALLRQAQVLTVCEHHRRWIALRYGVDAKLVRCGLRRMDRAQARPEITPPLVVAVARDVPKKGLDRLVRAVQGRASLRLVSDAPRLAGPGVEVGPVRPSEIPALLARAQLFALPLQVANDLDRDGIPVAMMEAMAAGLPVVTRPVSGVRELVDPAVGWIDEDFEAALDQALASPRERRVRGRAGRERITRDWTLRQSVDALQAAWATLRP